MALGSVWYLYTSPSMISTFLSSPGNTSTALMALRTSALTGTPSSTRRATTRRPVRPAAPATKALRSLKRESVAGSRRGALRGTTSASLGVRSSRWGVGGGVPSGRMAGSPGEDGACRDGGDGGDGTHPCQLRRVYDAVAATMHERCVLGQCGVRDQVREASRLQKRGCECMVDGTHDLYYAVCFGCPAGGCARQTCVSNLPPAP